MRSFAPMAHASTRSAARFGHCTHAHTGRLSRNHSTGCGPYACSGSVIGCTDASVRDSISSLTFVEPTDRSPSPAVTIVDPASDIEPREDRSPRAAATRSGSDGSGHTVD